MELGRLAGREDTSVPVEPGTLCRDVDRMFRADPDLRSVVVRAPDRPGLVLVNRARFFQVMVGPKGFGWALFAGKPIESILDQVDDELVMAAGTRLSDAGLALLGGRRVGASDDVLVVEEDGEARSLAVSSILAELARSYAARVEEIAVTERRFRSLVAGSSDVIIVLDADGTIIYISDAGERLSGYPASARIGASAFDMMHPSDVPACQALLAALWDKPGAEAEVHYRMRRADGELRWIEGVVRNLLHDEAVAGIVVNCRDVTERHALQEELRHQAFHDNLTGLPNRLLIGDRAEQMLARAERATHACAALLIDLDRFKDVNDLYGHAVGDRLLTLVGERLRLLLRGSDTVGRLGGDEFVALVEGDSLNAGPELVAARILEIFRTPFEVDGRVLNVTASIGIAIGAHETASDLFRDADIALYQAKGTGRDGFSIFSEEMKAEVERRGWLGADLPGALERNEFVIEYQPAFSLADGTMIGIEALLRWEHPQRGRIGPAEFVPTLEETGLIRPVGRWVLAQACDVAAALHAEGFPLALSVNVSARQLEQDEQLYRDVTDALNGSGLPAPALVLEITESTLMRDAEATARQLRRLKQLGVGIAIDDFGTGYSSLSYLATFPVDALKVDRSFVANLGRSSEADALLRSVLHLGRALSLRTVAEGIEHLDQLEILKRHGCDYGQGFHLARPGSVEQLRARLRATRVRTATA